MTPDVTMKDYYLSFIYEAKRDKVDYKNQLDTAIAMQEEIYSLIKDNENFYLKNYNINLSDYSEEWVNKNYNSSNSLYNKVIKLANSDEHKHDRVKLLQIVKYCNVLKNVYDYSKMFELADKRESLKFTEYEKLIMRYYNRVHKCVLEGNGYKFSFGIGIFCINRWLMDPKNMKKKTKLDYNATAIKKKEILDRGKKLYNHAEAKWYAERGLPYDGIDYRVYKTDTHFYEITFIRSNYFSNKSINFEHTQYVNIRHRGKSYKDMANECKDLNEIYNYRVDIRYKLNMLLHKFPNKYLLFIRNDTQKKYD